MKDFLSRLSTYFYPVVKSLEFVNCQHFHILHPCMVVHRRCSILEGRAKLAIQLIFTVQTHIIMLIIFFLKHQTDVCLLLYPEPEQSIGYRVNGPSAFPGPFLFALLYVFSTIIKFIAWTSLFGLLIFCLCPAFDSANMSVWLRKVPLNRISAAPNTVSLYTIRHLQGY